MRRLWVLLMATTGGCLASADRPADTAGEPPVCPDSKVSFCLYEFGGDCPTYEEAAAMSCDGYHFDPAGTVGSVPYATDGSKECPYPGVTCNVDYDPNLRTRMFFDGTGASPVRMIDLIWTDECAINGVLGESVC